MLFASGVAAETQSGTVRSGGQAIPGATVTATCGTDRITTVTDDAGSFEMGGLPATACRFSVGIFGFEPAQKNVAASSSPLTFDLQLQTRATLAQEPGAPGRGGFRRGGAPGGQGDDDAAAGTGQGRGGFGRGRGGRGGAGQTPPDAAPQQAANGTTATPGPGRGGRNAPNGQFQNLSLLENGDNPPGVQAEEVSPGGAGSTDSGDANAAFLVNGSLSQGVAPQPGDGFGLGAGGFGGGGFGGPGGPGGPNVFGGPATPGVPGVEAPGFAQAGPPGGPGGGGGGGGRGGGRGGRPPNRNVQFGNRINRGRGRQFQGSIFETIGNSAVNARPYSFTSPTTLSGAEVPKAAYALNRFGLSAGGPLVIPHLISGDKTFWFVNYTGVRSRTGFDDVTTVPTLAERGGNFSGLGTIINNPFTNAPFSGNVIPASLLDRTSLALLNYIPLPNAPGLRNNYQLIGANPSNSDNLQTRVNQTLTAKDGLDVNLNYQHRNSETIQPFGFADPTHGYGLSFGLTYRRTFNRSLINSLVWNFSRNLNQTQSAFSNGPNIEAQLGITGVSPAPAQYGPPTISFTNFGSLTDATPSLTRVQTSALNDSLIYIHGRQTTTFGVGFQRRQNNTLTDANARGTFNFTGLQTGYDLSDFLLSLPYQTSLVTYLNNNNARYLRETTLSGFATDDYRLRSNLTINAGLRWEFFAPYTEKNGQLANLDIAPGFTNVTQVLPGQTGPYSGSFPQGLIKPDYKLFSPRIGIAWKPWKEKQVVVRGGYGIYFNGSVYGQLASRLAGQPPFTTTTQLFQSAATPLSLENGFPLEQSNLIGNTFAVDKNYRPGYAQNWTTSIQTTFARVYVFEVAYNGIKGTALDVLQLPNRAPLGTPQLLVQNSLQIPNTGEFTYDSSVGNSSYNAAQVRFTRRLSRGASFNILYTFSKAIDDSSTLGGGPVLIPYNISAERALSPFDQRHTLRLNYNFQSPIANTRTGKVATLLRGWTIAGTLNATSGTPFTALVNGDTSGTGYTGNARAQATGLPVTTGSGFFNPAAFIVPATGTFGDAGRDTIPGIPQFTLNASFFRSFRLDDKRRLEFRIDSTNPINHVNISSINTTVSSIQYGLPVNASPMRSMTFTMRLRF